MLENSCCCFNRLSNYVELQASRGWGANLLSLKTVVAALFAFLTWLLEFALVVRFRVGGTCRSAL
jgi:hypothetical protein